MNVYTLLFFLKGRLGKVKLVYIRLYYLFCLLRYISQASLYDHIIYSVFLNVFRLNYLSNYFALTIFISQLLSSLTFIYLVFFYFDNVNGTC